MENQQTTLLVFKSPNKFDQVSTMGDLMFNITDQDVPTILIAQPDTDLFAIGEGELAQHPSRYPRTQAQLKPLVKMFVDKQPAEDATEVHRINMHSEQAITNAICEMKGLPITSVRCAPCAERGIQPAIRSVDPTYAARPEFMSSVGVVTFVNKRPGFERRVKAFVVEHSTNYIHVVEAGPEESIALAIITYIEQLRRWTKVYPRNLITSSPVINFAHVDDPLLNYCGRNSIQVISSPPLIRAPWQGQCGMFNYLNDRLIILTMVYGANRWHDNCFLVAAAVNRVPDGDGLTAFARLFQMADPRGALPPRTRIQYKDRNDRTQAGAFVGYHAERVCFEVADVEGRLQLATRVRRAPRPVNNQVRPAPVVEREQQRGPAADQRGQVRNEERPVERQNSAAAERLDAQYEAEQQRSPTGGPSGANSGDRPQDDLGDEPINVSLGDEIQQAITDQDVRQSGVQKTDGEQMEVDSSERSESAPVGLIEVLEQANAAIRSERIEEDRAEAEGAAAVVFDPRDEAVPPKRTPTAGDKRAAAAKEKAKSRKKKTSASKRGKKGAKDGATTSTDSVEYNEMLSEIDEDIRKRQAERNAD